MIHFSIPKHKKYPRAVIIIACGICLLLFTSIIAIAGFSSTYNSADSTSYNDLLVNEYSNDISIDEQESNPNSPTEQKNIDEQIINETFENENNNSSVDTTQTPTIQKLQPNQSNTSELVDVIRIVDGDTIVVSTYGTLRLIGIDTPETRDPRKPVQCWGKEATDQAKLILGGTQVFLEFDDSQQRVDRFGRTLAYVFRADGLHYNLQMIQEGFAREYTFRNAYKYQSEFKTAERNARSNQLGLWSPLTCSGTTSTVMPPDIKPTNTQNQPQTPTQTVTNPTNTPIPIATPNQPSPPVIQTSNVYNHAGNNYNCSDFKTWDEANLAYQESIRVTGKDIHRLDGDNNGIPCESLR